MNSRHQTSKQSKHLLLPTKASHPIIFVCLLLGACLGSALTLQADGVELEKRPMVGWCSGNPVTVTVSLLGLGTGLSVAKS